MLTLTTQRTFRTTTSVFLALLLAASLVGLAPAQAFAVTSAEKQAEADDIMRSIDSLQTQLNEANAEYERATQEYETAKAAAEDAAARVKAAKERIAELQERLSERATSMYKTGGSMSFIDVLLGATSFEDLVTSWDAFEKISSQDAELIQESKDVKAEAESAEQEYNEQKAKAAEEVENAKAAQQEIETTKASMEEELTRVNEEVVALQAKEEEERIAAEEAERRAEEARKLAESTVVPGTGGGGSSSAGSSGGDGSVNVSGWVNPCPSYYGVTNEFAWAGAWDGNYHNGIDLGAASGADILSAGPGTVTYVGWYGTGGNAVIVSHGNGVRTIYMHMSAQAATVGQQVSAGDLIGYVGSTGYSTGPHLHFQIEINGTPVNPRNYFSF
ncbi:metalloendopeptidase [Raoultibacter timonensis]|uniref:Metalloendopeptidase n=1 Tax=Raoultibacter timonensis TaxID=1907662 RepID=A0ABN6MHR7_9ACTN|nr:metalloendopeptidase [Raoultibacter timonensis]BDF51376.1 metalloendopeptidase [Raoultibacter timonensis]